MSLSVVIDLALGLMLVYFLFSLAASKINEAVMTAGNARAKGLTRGLARLVEGGTEAAAVSPYARLTVAKLVNHELIKNESPPGKSPAYLRPRAFSLAVIDLLAPPLEHLMAEMTAVAGPNDSVMKILTATDGDDATKVGRLRAALLPAGGTVPALVVPNQLFGELKPLLDEAAAHILDDPKHPLAQFRAGVDSLDAGHPAKTPLLRFVKDAQDDREKLIAELEGWYTGVMSRMSGWYKRKVQWFLLVYAVVLTLTFNVDTLLIAKSLFQDSGIRQAVATAAATQAAGKSPDDAGNAIKDAQSLSIPIGWVLSSERAAVTRYDGRHIPRYAGDWAQKVLGLLVTVGALSFGAPFWFDALGKLSNLRNNGEKPGAATGTATKAAPGTVPVAKAGST